MHKSQKEEVLGGAKREKYLYIILITYTFKHQW